MVKTGSNDGSQSSLGIKVVVPDDGQEYYPDADEQVRTNRGRKKGVLKAVFAFLTLAVVGLIGAAVWKFSPEGENDAGGSTGNGESSGELAGSPTLSPTTSPSRYPTTSPTTSPSRYPTSSPTTSPSRYPTTSPTTSPSRYPTTSPTTSPSRYPTSSPTTSPTTYPTSFPTRSPSISPTKYPTTSPTGNPTHFPTKSPTKMPTKQPTASPSVQIEDYIPSCERDAQQDHSLPPEVSKPLSVTTSSGSYVINTNAGLEITIDRSNCDIRSINYNGVELQSSYRSKYSHIRSGFGSSADVSLQTDAATYAKVSCDAEFVTHHMMFRGGENNIYFSTYQSTVDYSELRMLFRLKPIFDQCRDAARTGGDTTVTIEGEDVFRRQSDSATVCKYYGASRYVDLKTYGIASSANNVGVHYVIPPTGMETGVGGPFFRDIEIFCGTNVVDLTHYMNSDHVRTTPYRLGMHGPYAISFTDGPAPQVSDLDFTFVDRFKLENYTPVTVTPSTRGRVIGALQVDESVRSYDFTVAFINEDSQTWTKASRSNENANVLQFVGPPTKPGTYNLEVFRGEFKVYTEQVTITAGACTRVARDVRDDAGLKPAYFRIGDIDGTPKGFAGADLIENMHPTDQRMPASLSVQQTYKVGNLISQIPLVLAKDINNGLKITFNLTEEQMDEIRIKDIVYKINVYMSNSFAGGRIPISVNGKGMNVPTPPSQPRSRGITRGTWRGNNFVNTKRVGSGTLQAGENVIELWVASGSSGEGFLSPNVVLDSIEMILDP